MKGVILAGGNGTRLYPLTKVTNKHLLPVYNKPMIYYPIERLVSAGIKDIIIVTGKENAGNFMNLLGSGKEFGARFHYTLQDEAGGIAHALSLVKGFVNDDNITVILGDNIILDDISEYVSNFTSGARIFLKEAKDPQRFGVPEFDENQRIKRIEEKPKEPKSNYAVTGIYQYDNTVFDKISRLKPSARGELEITDVNNMYLEAGKLSHSFLKEPWLDAGTFESLLDASNILRERLSKN
ncbi:sugar phosphate nucleotidyltransferase [Candidatus Parvarchaeota archaeon]|jgi:glucose-1-phosphate thymidylyltransferase|nr:sugar phosphate nucleotidyltransferase [Candidatus Parvarchaeota archaeon]